MLNKTLLKNFEPEFRMFKVLQLQRWKLSKDLSKMWRCVAKLKTFHTEMNKMIDFVLHGLLGHYHIP